MSLLPHGRRSLRLHHPPGRAEHEEQQGFGEEDHRALVDAGGRRQAVGHVQRFKNQGLRRVHPRVQVQGSQEQQLADPRVFLPGGRVHRVRQRGRTRVRLVNGKLIRPVD